LPPACPAAPATGGAAACPAGQAGTITGWNSVPAPTCWEAVNNCAPVSVARGSGYSGQDPNCANVSATNGGFIEEYTQVGVDGVTRTAHQECLDYADGNGTVCDTNQNISAQMSTWPPSMASSLGFQSMKTLATISPPWVGYDCIIGDRYNYKECQLAPPDSADVEEKEAFCEP